jgi:hypothetical protein
MKCPENYKECEDYHPELPLESRCQRDSNAGYCTKRKEKVCERCGELYKPNIHNSMQQKYCSNCKKKAYKEHMKEYGQRPEVKEHRKKYYQNNRDKFLEHQKEYYQNNRDKLLEYQKEYNQRPEIIKKNKQAQKKRQIKKGLEQINDSIYVYDENGNKIGFKRDWFYAKYPKFTWDFYKEQGWVEKSLEMLNEANRICKGCGSHAMEVHHWRSFYKYPEIALKSSNLIVLCVFCHKEIHNKNKRYSLKIKELNKIN